MFFNKKKYTDQELEWYMHDVTVDYDMQKALRWYRVKRKLKRIFNRKGTNN